ncbi:MAG TPA: cysteine synthase family protein [Anaerolineales bacterium]|nr:cysteine synthase family protein [Anaerolineales bacterium]
MSLTQLGLSNLVMEPGQALEAMVGNTPLIALRRVTRGLPAAVRILAKAEWLNPSGSIKDRPALRIIQSALDRNQLGHGRRLLDSTSGNMGIAYATFGAALEIPVTLCVPASASVERLKLLRALGAEVVLTDAGEGSDGAILKARRMAEDQPNQFWYANQYDNEANWRAHYDSTGPEIVAQSAEALTHFVAGTGTSGTLVGTGRYLRDHLPAVQIIGIEPDSPLHGLEGLKHMPTAIRPAIYDEQVAHRVLRVSTESAYGMMRQLARQEGLFVGISSGAAAVAALQLAAELKSGTVITVFPDAGFKYLSDDALWVGA